MNIVMTVRSSCELETYIVAVERIKEYTELPTEVSCSSVYILKCCLYVDFTFYRLTFLLHSSLATVFLVCSEVSRGG